MNYSKTVVQEIVNSNIELAKQEIEKAYQKVLNKIDEDLEEYQIVIRICEECGLDNLTIEKVYIKYGVPRYVIADPSVNGAKATIAFADGRWQVKCAGDDDWVPYDDLHGLLMDCFKGRVYFLCHMNDYGSREKDEQSTQDKAMEP